MLGSVIGLQAALQHSPFAFVVYRLVEPFFRLNTPFLPVLPDALVEQLAFGESVLFFDACF